MKKLISTILFCVVAVSATAQNLSVTYVAKNAVSEIRQSGYKE